jgi:hypothetical protein
MKESREYVGTHVLSMVGAHYPLIDQPVPDAGIFIRGATGGCGLD